MKKLMWILFFIGIVAGLQAQSNQHVVTITDLNCQHPNYRSSLLDWGDGVTGSVDIGTGVAGSAGYGTGLPNEEMLECVVNGFPGQVGYWLTLTIDDSAPIDLTICLDGLGYQPAALAYWVNNMWIYISLSWEVYPWIAGCVTVPIDPNYSRTTIDIPIVFSSSAHYGDYGLIGIVGFNNNCYEDGDPVEITIDYGANTGPSGFDVIVVTKLLDANFATIDSTFRLLSIFEIHNNDPFTEILTIPIGAQSPWLAQTKMYHVTFSTISQTASTILEIEDCTPIQNNAWIRYIDIDTAFEGSPEITIEVDTDLPEQDIRVETNLIVEMAVSDSTSRYLTIMDEQDEPFTEILTIPFGALTPWLCQVIVYDAGTYIQQDMRFIELPHSCPVPVTLSSFNAVYENSTPTLHWTTQSESNNLGWNVYRSLSENIELANQINNVLIPGYGTTSEPTDYVFTDTYEVENNTSYWYWLESTSYSGETEIFGPVTLTIQIEDNQTPDLPTESILQGNYPNPFNPHTMIRFSIQDGENGALTIFNTRGQLLETHNYEAGDHELNWDAAKYGSGIYFYKLETENFINIKKMIMVK